MDRNIVYPGAIPLDSDVLTLQKSAMVAIGSLVRATLGTATVVDGLAISQTTVASMVVNIGPGSMTLLSTVDATAFGSVGSDTADALVKMGINLTTTPLTLTAPAVGGQAQNYLVQAAFSETDSGSVVLPYYNSSNPAVPYSGPSNSGAAQNTQRIQRVNIQLKAGAAAASGSQTTPAPDAGFTALYAITVLNGQTQITTANLATGNPNGAAVVPGAPFVDAAALGKGIRPGRMLGTPQKVTATGSQPYTPSANMALVNIRLQSAGGASGGAVATDGTHVSIGTPGGSGAYLDLWLTSAQVTAALVAGVLPITLGAAGVGASGLVGGAGGVSTIGTAGAIASVPGGLGGPAAAAVDSTTGVPSGATGGGATAAPTVSVGVGVVVQAGAPGGAVAMLTALSPLAAVGGAPSELGSGGTPSVSLGGNGGASPNPGAGGGPCFNGVSHAALTGGAGGGPWMEITEYS